MLKIITISYFGDSALTVLVPQCFESSPCAEFVWGFEILCQEGDDPFPSTGALWSNRSFE